ncbi:hypothetical protein EIN43_12275 [Enterobacter hormaechei]|uniref:Uncharacterized protein n=1 Tax=Enterobacter hormaechei TaxID=158836 RepID=A0A4Y5ZNX5_9ENTR|nr:hypothetical protein EIN43_12275 [Enterobacter hormaechei]
MIIYYLHHCNFRCTVSLLYVERWQIQRRDTMSKATNTAATKRNNRKIHARKFPQHQRESRLAKKQEEREEIKLARAANNMF